MSTTLLAVMSGIETKGTNFLRMFFPFLDGVNDWEGTEAADWTFENLFGNLTNSLKSIGGALMSVLGVIMIIVGAVKIAKGLISHGKDQTNWVVVALLLIVGAAFLFGGITLIVRLGRTGYNSIDQMGTT